MPSESGRERLDNIRIGECYNGMKRAVVFKNKGLKISIAICFFPSRKSRKYEISNMSHFINCDHRRCVLSCLHWWSDNLAQGCGIIEISNMERFFFFFCFVLQFQTWICWTYHAWFEILTSFLFGVRFCQNLFIFFLIQFKHCNFPHFFLVVTFRVLDLDSWNYRFDRDFCLWELPIVGFFLSITDWLLSSLLRSISWGETK